MSEEIKNDVKPEGSTEHVNVRVTDNSTEIFFKLKRSTALRKVMDAFSKRTGKDMRSLRFLYDGERVNEADTPGSVSSKRQRKCWHTRPLNIPLTNLA